MSVIGRLDEQVDTVLIAPLAKKGEQDASTTAQPHENRKRSQTATGTARETEDSSDTPARRDELPVWLL